MCESSAVFAVSGKMLGGGQAAILADAAKPNSLTNCATRSGFSPKDRVLMMGLPGLLFTSASGA